MQAADNPQRAITGGPADCSLSASRVVESHRGAARSANMLASAVRLQYIEGAVFRVIVSVTGVRIRRELTYITLTAAWISPRRGGPAMSGRAHNESSVALGA